MARLKHYNNRHETSWDSFVQPIIYGYNTQMHRATRTFPISLILSRELPGASAKQKITADNTSLLIPTLTNVKGADWF